MKNFLNGMLMLFFLVGCASMNTNNGNFSDESQVEILSQIPCDPDSFYAFGVNSGKNGEDMAFSPAIHCDPRHVPPWGQNRLHEAAPRRRHHQGRRGAARAGQYGRVARGC